MPLGSPGSDAAGAASPTSPNALLREWAGPYGGVPPFDAISVSDFKPALEAAMAEELAEVDRIASDPAPPTFENTIAALERTGRKLDRVTTAYGVWSSTMNTSDFQPVEREMAPRLAAHSDRITQNSALFRRIDAVYASPAKAELTAEQQRLAWLYQTNFVRAGARLDDAAKSRLSAMNQRLAELYTSFSQNVLADETERFVVLGSEAELAGLPQSLRDGAAAAARARGLQGGWVISNSRSFVDPFLTYSEIRELREKVWRMFVDRGDNPGEHNNNQIVSEILALRAERAALLGYATHAHWRLENTMAKTPERAVELLEAVWRPAVARVAEEVRDMQTLARAEGSSFTIEPWDYRYYAEKVRKQRYDLDQSAVKPYLRLELMREAMFWVAGQLFGFAFAPVTVPVYHRDVRVWEVTDAATGGHVGLWYFDPYARAGKRSGAWMNSFRRQERFERDITTIVSNNSNFAEGAPGEPVLISWDDAITLFHEFGHALHGLCSQVNYPSLSGTSVPRDYVEFPSQLLEHWLTTPQVLQQFALHYRTGEPIPQALVDRIDRASKFNQGFATTEYIASAIVDLRMHLAGDRPVDAAEFERRTLAELGMPREIVMRHRAPHFLHVFDGDGYSAGYYSYLWADVLTADAHQAFLEAGGLYDPALAAKLREHVFSRGNTMDPADAYRGFRGRDPRIEALMVKRGFSTTQ